MTDAELIEEIKVRLGLTGNYHDSLIGALAEDVKYYILDAGADPENDGAVGLIARGVCDLWNFGAGNGQFSQVFYQRLLQMSLPGDPTITGVIPEINPITPEEIDDVVKEVL